MHSGKATAGGEALARRKVFLQGKGREVMRLDTDPMAKTSLASLGEKALTRIDKSVPTARGKE